MLDLHHQVVDVRCPRCAYLVEVQILDVRTQVYRWCPCCRVLIHLVEPDGSISVSIDAAESAMHSLEETLRKAFG